MDTFSARAFQVYLGNLQAMPVLLHKDRVVRYASKDPRYIAPLGDEESCSKNRDKMVLTITFGVLRQKIVQKSATEMRKNI